ncbi:hypothetical protein D3C79_757910 [compost metagenome]
MRAGVRPGHRVQTAGGSCLATGQAPAAPGAGAATSASPGGAGRRPRPGLARSRGHGQPGGAGGAGRRRPAVHHVHLRHHRQTQGDCPGKRRQCRGPGLCHAPYLWHAGGGCVVGDLRRWLGGWPFVDRLRAADERLHHGVLRRQADPHARRRGLLAGGRAVPGQRPVLRAHRHACDPQGRP